MCGHASIPLELVAVVTSPVADGALIQPLSFAWLP